MPFSTGVDDGYVISFGLPFLMTYLFFVSARILFGQEVIVIQNSLLSILGLAYLLVMLMLLFSLFSPSIFQSLPRALVNVAGALLASYLIVRKDLASDIVLERLLRTLVYSGVIMAVYFISTVLFRITQYGVDNVMVERFTGGLMSLPWGATNTISAALLFPHLGIYLFKTRYGLRYADLMVFVIFLAVVITMSRTGLLAHGLLLVVASLILGRGRLVAIGFLSVLAFGYLFFVISPETFDLLLSNRLNFEGGNGRFESWQQKVEFLAENPLIPIGYYGSLNSFDGLSAHNFILTVLLEQGFAGVLIVVLFLWSAYQKVMKTPCYTTRDRMSRQLILAGSMIVFLGLQVEDANYTQQFIMYFWLFFAIAILFSKIQRNKILILHHPQQVPI